LFVIIFSFFTWIVAADSPSPPDLLSQFHDRRTIFVGSSIIPPAAQLIISQLLHLSWESPKEEIAVYINCPGSVGVDGMSYHTEAFAVVDTMLHIPCPIKTSIFYFLVLSHFSFYYSSYQSALVKLTEQRLCC
jgi:hypothetical protein